MCPYSLEASFLGLIRGLGNPKCWWILVFYLRLHTFVGGSSGMEVIRPLEDIRRS